MSSEHYIHPDFVPGLVSVIVPVYNREHLISETLDSILEQTYRPIEIVVINDGSTDCSIDILNQYASRNPGIFNIIDQHNTGQVAARNNGIRTARGEFIAFLDSDDKWHPLKLEKQIPMFSTPNVALVYSGLEKIDESGRPFQTELCDPSRTDELYMHLLVSNQMTGGTVVVTRAVLNEVGLFDESFKAAENWDLWLRVCRDHRAKLVNEPLVQYRVHGQNMSKDRMLMIQAKEAIISKHCSYKARNEEEAKFQNLAYADIDYCRGVHYFSNGQYQQAKPFFKNTIKRHALYKDSLVRLIRCYLGSGNRLLSNLKKKLKAQ